METQNNSKRVIVVTGANKGIGYCIVKGVLQLSDKPTVVLTARSEELGQKSIKKLQEEVSDSKDSLYFHQLDVADDSSVNNFRDWLKEKFGKVDVLVNNAGVAYENDWLETNETPTRQDYDYIVGTNYHKTREFTEKLTPLLTKDGKIINIASELGDRSMQGKTANDLLRKPDFGAKDLDEFVKTYKKALDEKRLKPSGFTPSLYKISKALMNMWTAHVLTQQLKGDQQAFAVWPGWCKTDLGGWDQPPRTAEQGADTVVYLVGLPYKLDTNIHGRALKDRKVVEY